MTTDRTAAVSAAGPIGRLLLFVPVLCAAVVVPLLPPLAWKVQVAMAAAVLQAGGLYILARTGALRRSPLDVPALAFLAAAIAATAVSVDRLVSFYPSPLRGDGLLVSVGYVLAGLGAARLSERERGLLLWAMLAGGGLIGIVALGQYYGADAVPWAGFSIVQPQGPVEGTTPFVFEPTILGTRSIATLGQPLALGGLAVLLLPAAVALTVQASRPSAGLLSATAAVALYGALVVSQTRAAWIGAAIAGALLVPLLPRSPGVWRRLTALAAVLAAMTVLLAATRPQAALPGRVVSIVKDVQRSDQSLGQRLYMWTHVVPLIRQRPVLGWGFSTMLSRFPDYGSAEYRRRFGTERVELIDNPHNELLNIAFSMGLAGLAAYLWVWVVSVSGAVRSLRRGVGAPRLAGALLAGLAAYFVWMQSAWSHVGVATVLWVVLGLAASSEPTP